MMNIAGYEPAEAGLFTYYIAAGLKGQQMPTAIKNYVWRITGVCGKKCQRDVKEIERCSNPGILRQ